MNDQDLLAAISNTPRKTQPISTPYWPGTDGHIAIADVPIDDLVELKNLAKTDPASYSAALACRTLVNRETGNNFLNDAMRDTLKRNGSVLMLLMQEINSFFGFDTKAAIEAAKNA